MQEMTAGHEPLSKFSAAQGSGNVRFTPNETAAATLLQTELNVGPNLRFATPQPNIFFQQFDVERESFFFFRNPNSLSQDFTVTFDAGSRVPQIWNPWTGKIVEAPAYRSENGGVTLNIHLDPYGSELIGLVNAPEERYVVRTNFPAVQRTAEGVFGVTAQPGNYSTEFSDHKKITTAI